MLVDLGRAVVTADNSQEVWETVEDQYNYHKWTDEQIQQGAEVRNSLAQAAFAIIRNVPPSADRSAALRKLREARMDANSAITHNGKY